MNIVIESSRGAAPTGAGPWSSGCLALHRPGQVAGPHQPARDINGPRAGWTSERQILLTTAGHGQQDRLGPSMRRSAQPGPQRAMHALTHSGSAGAVRCARPAPAEHTHPFP